MELIFGKGISRIGSLLDCAVKYDIIEKKGAWYSYGEEKVGQGRDNAREYLEQHPDFANDLEVRLRKQIFPGKEFPATKSGGKAVTAAPTAKEAVAAAATAKPGGKTAPAAEPVPATAAKTDGKALSEEALF
jgi:recombination protein RecA